MGSDNREATAPPTGTPAIISTAQAAYYAEGTSLQPCCWVNVYGPPGDTMVCNVSENATLLVPPPQSYDGDGASYGTGPYNAILDVNGMASFIVRAQFPSPSINARSNLLLVTASARDPRGGPPLFGYPTFQPYTDANPQNLKTEHFVAYNYTTGAPADGLTPCCIYVKADSAKWGVVQIDIVTKNSLAKVVGATREGWVNLQSDGSAVIVLTDIKAEIVQFTIGLPHAPGTDQLKPFTVNFCEYPGYPAPSSQDRASAA